MKRRQGEASQVGGAWLRHSLAMRMSPAWAALTDADHRVLRRLELEHLLHGGTRNGRLTVTYNQFEETVRRKSVAESIRRLEALGFVEAKRYGYKANGVQQPTDYRLTYLDSRHDTGGGKYFPAPRVTDDWQKLDTAEKVAAALASTGTASPKRGSRSRPDRPPPRQNVDRRGQNATASRSGQIAPGEAA